MTDETGDILIVGAGAIGGATGAILYKKGIDVVYVNRKGPHYEKLKSAGLMIEGSEEAIKVPVVSSIKELKQKFRHILVTTKNLSTAEVSKSLSRVMTKESLVYSLQNGFGNTEIMAKYLPQEQVVAGVVGWGATKVQPGVVRITSQTGNFVLGFEGRKSTTDPRLLDIQQKLQLWKPTIITDNIVGYRWSKLIVNSIIASYGGLLNLSVGEMLGTKRLHPLLAALKEEGILVADALNIKLEKVDNMDVKAFFYKPHPADKFLEKVKYTVMSSFILKIGAKRHGKIRSSLVWDLEQGRKTEVDFLNGYIEKKAKECKLEVPINSFLVKAIHEIERGKRKMGLANLEELEAIAKISQEKIKEQEKNVH